MSRALLFTLITFLFQTVNSQTTYRLNGSFSGLSNEIIYLMQVSGENRTLIDTTRTDATGAFLFEMNEQLPAGMYIAIHGPGQAVEFIYNYEDIQFVTTGFEGDDQVQVINSVENLLYYNYLFLKGNNLFKMDLIRPILEAYPADDPFYQTAVNQYKKLKTQLSERVTKMIQENPKTLAAKYIKTDQPVIAPLGLSMEKENTYLKNHYFEEVDFNDTLLIKSSFLTSKVVQFMSLYQYNSDSQESLEDNLLVAVDTILSKAAINQKTYEFLVDFLIKGFESIGFERGLAHIANSNQLDQFCENTERKAMLANKLEYIRKLALGQKAPGFSAVDLQGDSVVLDSIRAKTTVLVFWASWCPHCDEILPIIKNYYDQTSRDELEVVTFSVDDSKEALLQSISEGGYTWHNVGAFKGWEGPVINEYGIAATPTVLILGSDKTILSKPLGKEKVRNELKGLLGK